ncbi:MAG TPA: hypothetical protein VLA35_10265 [Thermoleophilia bacterium]|nr:hypothetical protein [Thermoleophilia bacterium]
MKRRPLGRLVMALVPLPWTAFYAVVGGWATAEGLAALIDGRARVQVSSSVVEPSALLLVGIGFLVAFAAMLGVTVLVLLERRGRLWTLELVVLLAVWAGGLWAIYRSSLGAPAFLLAFFGLFFATAVAAVMVVSRPPEVIEAGPGKSTSA